MSVAIDGASFSALRYPSFAESLWDGAQGKNCAPGLRSVCGACLRRPPRFDASHAVFRYEFPIDSLIHALKYGHRLASADFLARSLLEVSPPPPPDLIIPVPLAPNRLAERGFNQAVELARPLARQWQVPLELTGVTRALDILTTELSRAMALAGCATIHDITRDLVREAPRR